MTLPTRKRIAAFLAAMLMAMSAVACGNTEEKDTKPAPQESVSDTDTETETEQLPTLPDSGFDGYTYRILCTDETIPYALSEGSNGDAVNDAIYEANSWVQEKLDIKITHVSLSGDKDSATIKNHLVTNDDAYDIAQMHDCTSAGMMLNGWLLNVMDLPYVDTTAPWWPKFTVDSLTLNHRMYLVSNYISYLGMASTRGVFFNQDLYTDLGKTESVFDLVRNGGWTLDKMIELTQGVYNDLNADGKIDEGDVFGFFNSGAPYTWMEGFGFENYKKAGDDSAELSLTFNSEEVYTFIDKMYNWLYSGSGDTYNDMKSGASTTPRREAFATNRALFTISDIEPQLKKLLDVDLNYAILPYPKATAEATVNLGACTDKPMFIPKNIRSTECAGAVLEAMSYAGYQYILPAYCERALKNRYATSPEAKEMLDILFANRVLSFSYLFVNEGPGMQVRILTNTIGAAQPNNGAASYFQKNQKAELNTIEKITKFFSAEEE